MSILADTNYLIMAHFYGEHAPDKGPSTYVGTLEELQRAIRTTWSKIPHDMKISENFVGVFRPDSDEKFATFVFTELTRQKIPDHF